MKEIVIAGETGDPVTLRELDFSVLSEKVGFIQGMVDDLYTLKAKRVIGDDFHWTRQMPGKETLQVVVESGTDLRQEGEFSILGELKEIGAGNLAEKVIFGSTSQVETEAVIAAAEHIIFHKS